MKTPLNTPLKALGICLLLGAGSPLLAATSIPGWGNELLQQLRMTSQWQALEYQNLAAREDQNASAQPLYNPELEFSYEDKDAPAYQVTLSQQLDLHGKSASRLQNARIEQQLQRLQQQQTVNRLSAEALRSLIEIERSRLLFDLSHAQLEITQRLIKLTRHRVNAGDTSEIDLKLVQLSLTEALQAEADARTTLQTERSRQNNLLGATGVTLPERLRLDTTTTPDFTTLTQNSPQAQIANLEAQRAQISIQQARRDAKADPTLGLGLGEDGDDNVVALTLSVPLHIRNNYRAEIRAQEARAEAADHRLVTQLRETENNLQRNWANMLRLQQLLGQWQPPSDSNLAQLNGQLEKLWRLGDLTTTAYLQNLQQLNAVMAAEINLKAQANQSIVDWLQSSNQLVSWLKQQ